MIMKFSERITNFFKGTGVSFKIDINLTWSKAMAAVVLLLGFILDLANKAGGTVFMYTIPFVVFLITGKQFIDKGKPPTKSE